ncbi:hypothetical protein [Candidatus Laterigemmans baculatus]|uniref:hypothetical protein n=1 Tax=Candidatus Laterigemmans baculatus TaxID=2770505 RepID=UPI0013DB0A24|nr:hypothetical protein [Candidatus Laterigemmans baculatus]
MHHLKTLLVLGVLLLLGSATPKSTHAHFPWLALDAEGRAILFFGENPADREYAMPESIAAAQVQHQTGEARKPLTDFAAVETDGLIGRRSAHKFATKGQLQSTVDYGLYHGMKLTYSAQAILDRELSKAASKPTGNLDLEAVVGQQDGGITAQIFWRGKPLSEAEVQLLDGEGQEKATATTDADGRVSFPANKLEAGLHGLLVGQVDKTTTGEFNGTPYTGEAHYLTVTFVRP